MTGKSLRILAILLALVLLLAAAPLAARAGDPLPSWRDGAAKQAIAGFVAKVTREGGPDYLPPGQRIAVFDNDGTLWAEKPFYFQLAFALDQVKRLAPRHPEWKTQAPFSVVLSGDAEQLAKLHTKDILTMVVASHAGITTAEYKARVKSWLETAKHPQRGVPYTELVYRPMLELLAFLRANEFKTYIVSGGGVDFMRVFAEEVYGIPPEQVIGSSLKTRWEMRNGRPVIVKLPELQSIDDKDVKPLNINLHIGRRPVFAAGNSDGDLAMLEWTAAGPGPRFTLLVHHDDAAREWAYDRKSPVGHLDKALDWAKDHGCLVVSMKRDFARVFPGDK